MQPIIKEPVKDTQEKTLTFNKALGDFALFMNQYSCEDFLEMKSKRFIESFSFRCFRELNNDVLVLITNLFIAIKQPNTDTTLSFHYFDEEQALQQFDWMFLDYNEEYKTVIAIFVKEETNTVTMVMYDKQGTVTIGYRKFL